MRTLIGMLLLISIASVAYADKRDEEFDEKMQALMKLKLEQSGGTGYAPNPGGTDKGNTI